MINTIDRRDPDYEPPKYNGEEMENMYYEHSEEERKESTIETVEKRDIKSTEEIF